MGQELNPALQYADSYRDMARQGVETVKIFSVVTDLERNIAPLYAEMQAKIAEQAREIERLRAFRNCCARIVDQLGDSPKSAFSRLRDAVSDTDSCAALKAQPSGVVLPDLFDMRPFQTVDRGSTNYKAGFNAAVRKMRESLNSLPVSADEYGDAYKGAREDLAIWKRRALESETKVREQDQIIESLGNALNAENGPTFMGEPVISAGVVDEREAFEAWYLSMRKLPVNYCGLELCRDDEGGYKYRDPADSWRAWQARAALTAQPDHSAQSLNMVPDGKMVVTADALYQVLYALVNAPHLIRELQATREPATLFADNPINMLIAEYEAAHAAATTPGKEVE